LGTKVYVTNYRSGNVSVIDTNSNSIVDTIDIGIGPRGLAGSGVNMYVENFDDGTMSVINTNSGNVTATLDIGHSPSGLAFVGSNLYVSSFQDGLVRILDTGSLVMQPEPVVGGNQGSGHYVKPGIVGFENGSSQTIETGDVQEKIPEKTCEKITEFMKIGVKGQQVNLLQDRLNKNNFSAGVVDGIFGKITDQAVRSFQRARNLVADGLVGPLTREVLNKSCGY
jgi:YVTN family beta-propeller protein